MSTRTGKRSLSEDLLSSCSAHFFGYPFRAISAPLTRSRPFASLRARQGPPSAPARALAPLKPMQPIASKNACVPQSVQVGPIHFFNNKEAFLTQAVLDATWR